SIPTPCPYAKFGCSARYPRSELRPLHLASGECVYEPFKEGLARANEMWEGLEEENWVLRRKVQKLEDVVQLLQVELGVIKTSLGRFLQLPSSSETSQPASDSRTPPPPSLPDILDTLRSTSSAQKDAISALSTSQTAQQATNQHLADEVSALRHAVGGMRGVMSGMLGEIQRLSSEGAIAVERETWMGGLVGATKKAISHQACSLPSVPTTAASDSSFQPPSLFPFHLILSRSLTRTTPDPSSPILHTAFPVHRTPTILHAAVGQVQAADSTLYGWAEEAG
ncbi:hypothetical protein JCM11641_003014, partial [Rhodosporidiobolus odoratus]